MMSHRFVTTAAFLLAASGGARAADITVFATVAAKSALEQIVPAFEASSGHHVTLRIATTGELKSEIEKGAHADVAFLTVAALNELIQQGKLDGAGQIAVARSGVGVAVARGAPQPAMANAEDFKRTLLAAKSISYSAQGATGPTMKKIFEQFGIADTMNAKTVIISKITAPQAVAAGQAEMGFTQISEIFDAPEAQFAGPLPAEVQVYSTFSAAPSAAASDRAAAQAFVNALAQPAAKAILKARGLEPL
ncbi:molybdate transport system substrate-binding protein [Duganella sp. 1224]|uniref:molybdate ABC transporter substrate-binding protein n=1 Tax=Duganella sp. 1224 TaxID=2587052 RepID=UPI0015CA781C|nr:substrate-binding domain-containing protein [Duganella sp. 1224]NYE62821.1 molybdate transport system substrate-binding protein [Duganella sp. 1224]